MPPDPIRAEEVLPWLEKAKADLRVAETIIKLKPPVFEFVLFHCQQAIEKSLKAFLIWHDVRFQKTHDLRLLGQQCARLDPSLEILLQQAAPLSEYAWKFRYPGEETAPKKTDAVAGLRLAKKVLSEIRKKLPLDAL